MRVILYTTQYRKGGREFAQVARTLYQQLADTSHRVLLCRVEHKKEVVELFKRLESDKIDGLYFVGHSGLYGPMFGTIDCPEQFSPYEWRNLRIPFRDGAEAHWLCCRSARWFAPFFAETHNVVSYGFYCYTSFSTKPHQFKRLPSYYPSHCPLYVLGMPAKKSHGWWGSLRKHLGQSKPEQAKRFTPQDRKEKASYNGVAIDYAEVFSDIRVRQKEVSWIKAHLTSKDAHILDIGCGNGALLRALSDDIAEGIGVDLSTEILKCAEEQSRNYKNLGFKSVTGPHLPLEDKSIDVAISMLSFRYLDWDPIVWELQRVLKPNGIFLMVDMMEAPVSIKKVPLALVHRLQHRLYLRKFPLFKKQLRKMVQSDSWKTMLTYNPIRAQHEYLWFMRSRFPQMTLKELDIGWHSKVMAFHSGPMHTARPFSVEEWS